ncbi:SGNH/GDSL hydrolase family protein [Stenotrophomonas beteli]|uniref:SGNH/GDSL hydrolase family protein n=1 Tax=Stenotrophomonas beteli TaxID=3384461 RepID=UPI000B23C126|nr:SGNH/GDSL hydrolase family protein [Stenotrophomonas maltophilia]
MPRFCIRNWHRRWLGCLFATLLCLATSLPLAAHEGRHPWSASWFAAQQDYGVTFPDNIVPPPPPVTLADQTVRMTVRLSRGGETLRVRFSNRFGKAPVTLEDIHVAPSMGGDGVVLHEQRQLRFSGSARLMLAPGEERWSDRINLRVADQTELSVSLYVMAPTPVVTTHSVGLQTNYRAPGNQVGAALLRSADTMRAYYWLDAIDVAGSLPPAAHGRPVVMVAFGDSITDGAGSTVDRNFRWPNLLDDRVRSADLRGVSVVNAGIAGNRWLHDGVGPAGVSRFGHDVLAVSGASHAVLLLGINDIGIGQLHPPQAVSAAQLIDALGVSVQRARQRGIKVMLGTLLPYGGSGYFDAAGETKRQAVNDWIRAAQGVDEVIDFDRIMRDPKRPTHLRPDYDSGDHLHPSDAGYAAMADAFPIRWLQR